MVPKITSPLDGWVSTSSSGIPGHVHDPVTAGMSIPAHTMLFKLRDPSTSPPDMLGLGDMPPVSPQPNMLGMIHAMASTMHTGSLMQRDLGSMVAAMAWFIPSAVRQLSASLHGSSGQHI